VVYTHDSLRFAVPVTGDNALRVRINLLAERDVLEWKLLTQHIKSEQPPEDPTLRRIHGMLQGKLEEIKPGRTPMKRNMPEIIGALNDLLRRKDFYDAQAWAGKQVPAEAGKFLSRGADRLSPDELIRMNRLLLTVAMPQAIADSENEHQAVKAKLFIPVQHRAPDGKIVKDKPRIFSAQGQVVREPEAGKVVIDLASPPAEVVEYMKRQRGSADLPQVTTTGNVVVGRISLFRFLFK
jgi:hypothetical protein